MCQVLSVVNAACRQSLHPLCTKRSAGWLQVVGLVYELVGLKDDDLQYDIQENQEFECCAIRKKQL